MLCCHATFGKARSLLEDVERSDLEMLHGIKCLTYSYIHIHVSLAVCPVASDGN